MARRGLRTGKVELDTERLSADLVQLELELGDYTEVPAAAPQTPEQLGVLVRRCADHLAGRGDHLEGDHVVAGQAVLTGQPAHPAAEGEAADPGVRDVAGGCGQSVWLGGRVERAQ